MSTAFILMYHRVMALPSDPWALAVTPQHFKEHLEILNQWGQSLQLRQLISKMAESKAAPNSFVVTFDDGYADNLIYAKPVLESYGINATIFLVSGNIGQEREFWWDELEGILLQPGQLPESLSLSISGKEVRGELGDWANYSDDDFRKHCGWKVGEQEPTKRHSLYYELWEILRSLSEADRQNMLQEISNWAGAGKQSRTSHRTLSANSVISLAKDPLIELGCHTATHQRLSTLSQEEQDTEIRVCKTDLESLTGFPMTSFAYPFGGEEDFSPETVSLVRKAGFHCACSTFHGVVRKETDRFRLPRLFVGDWDGDTFQKELNQWLCI